MRPNGFPLSFRGRRFSFFGALLVGLGLLVPAALHAQGFTEFSLPAGNVPWGITAGPDGALWFADFAGHIGRITTDGTITEFAVSGGPEGIAAGPDGKLWFTESSVAKIGRITTSGVVTEFPISGAAVDITAGSDGALWFTEQSAGKIGRLTTAGALTEYSIPTANSFPQGITAGPDGALWFTEAGADKIGRITTAGSITEFPVTADVGLYGITAGPDGALWFNESQAHKIGRMTTAGDLTEFPLPSSTRTFDIASGPDGNLWFTEFDADRIGRITPSGVATEYFTPTADSKPLGITAGPDDNLWFTEFAAAKIGVVTPPETLTITTSGSGASYGLVNSVPAGLSCGATCSADFPPGTSVTLSASVAHGVTFEGWSGGGCWGSGTCEITMDRPRTVDAAFETSSCAVVLSYATVVTTEEYVSCDTLTVGPDLRVEAPGNVTVMAATRVVLGNGFSVGPGAAFHAGTDPALAP